jgi:uncharacterized RDD family membrane protein YckC
MFCKRCGLKVEEGNRFCQACGQEMGNSTPISPVTASAPAITPVPYAGFWIRFVASLIDGLILGIPFMFVVIVLMFFFGGFGLMMHRNAVDPQAAAALAGPLLLGLLLGGLFFMSLEWLYFAGMESSERQATFGKAAMSVRVTDLEGRRLSFGHATGRFFSKIISGMIPLAIGYIMAGFTAKKQALHDMIAGTLVLRKS